MSNPDDVFCTNIQRPVDVAHPVAPVSCFEEHRRLCNVILDGRVDVLRSLLVDGELDVNARSKTGNTAGHEVRYIHHVSRCICHQIISSPLATRLNSPATHRLLRYRLCERRLIRVRRSIHQKSCRLVAPERMG